MATEYQLKFADGVEPSALASWLRAGGFGETSAPATFVAPGLTATITDATDRFGLWAPLGFSPRVQVFFAHDRRADYEEMVARLVDAVALLLREVPVDAAMTADNEIVLLLRRRGELVLTNRDDWWILPTFEPKLADRLGEPHRLEPLPIL